MATHAETPITRWLQANRKAARMSQVALVADLERVTGWALLRENYSKYETGATSPEPETLERFLAYWASRGVEGPDLTPPPVVEPEPSLATALRDLARELAALREERTALARRVEDLAATVELLAAPRLEGNGGHATPGFPRETAG